MWKYVKVILFSMLASVVGVSGAAAWILFTPVTEANVQGRVVQACIIGATAMRVDNWGRALIRSEPMSFTECQCIAGETVRRLGGQKSALLGDALRLQAGYSIRAHLGGDGRRAVRESPHIREATAMLAAAALVAPICINPPVRSR